MKKKYIIILLSFIITSSFAQEFEVDGIRYNVISSLNKTVEVGIQDDERLFNDVVLPSSIEYNGDVYAVIRIGEQAFNGCEFLFSIIIPEGVTSIKTGAFIDCVNLKSVSFPSTLLTIFNAAFSDCVQLESIFIPRSVVYIGPDAFLYCTNLKSIKVEEGNPVYDSREDCNAIIETTNGALLYGCENTSFPEGVESIGFMALSMMPISNVEFPYTLTFIDEGAFSACLNITSVAFPSSVRTIGPGAFIHCQNLSSIEFSEGVTTFGDGAFLNCKSLTSLVIPHSVTTIGQDAFRDCSSIESIVISEGVTSIGKSAFIGCSSLTSVTSLINTPFEIPYNCWIKPTTDESLDYWKDVVLYVPKGTKALYENTVGWDVFLNIKEIESESTAIEEVNGLQTTDATIFDINGRRLPQQQRGLNIINGKKVFSK